MDVKTEPDGRRAMQFGLRHDRPTAASFYAIYALPQGIPVGTIQLGGIGDRWNPPPFPFCWPIFIASDRLGKFGHLCRKCNGYWRSGAPSRWRMTCPYCGVRAEAHLFLAEGQLKYVESCCEFIEAALQSENDGRHIVDMDEVADAVGKDIPKPRFYYAEESQQNKFTCQACGEFNDILGRYGYCSSCGTHNGLGEMRKDIILIKDRLNVTEAYEACVKDAIAAFDSFARQIAKQLAGRIPMTRLRRKEWERKLFHNLKQCAQALLDHFDINAFKALQPKESEFAILMFHRRHAYEHNGGEVDEKYIRDSGDTSVRIKQVIRETRESVLKTCDIIVKMGMSIDQGFHEIFPPEEMPVRIQREIIGRNPE